MEAVVLCGIQASGKTTFFAERFLATHVRISLDLLRTRHRESRFLRACLETGMPFVADGTNATREHRARYVVPAREAGFRCVAFWLDVPPQVALARNAGRDPSARVPVAGVLGTKGALVLPGPDEGFAEVLRVTPDGEGGFTVGPLRAASPAPP